MQRIFAGTVVFLSLIVIADIEQTSTLAVAFAYLILFSAIWAVGPVAFARISSGVGASPTSNAASGGRSVGGSW